MSGELPSSGALIDYLESLFADDAVKSVGGDRLPNSEHMLQTAAVAERQGADGALVAAALLHDIGHWLNKLSGAPGGRDGRHEVVGAKFLEPYFDTAVTRPIALHVAAKRYLCARETGYLAELSAGSVRSLEFQGGAMSPDEVSSFESIPEYENAVSLRRFDEYGKLPGLEVPRFEHYRPLLMSLLRASENHRPADDRRRRR